MVSFSYYSSGLRCFSLKRVFHFRVAHEGWCPHQGERDITHLINIGPGGHKEESSLLLPLTSQHMKDRVSTRTRSAFYMSQVTLQCCGPKKITSLFTIHRTFHNFIDFVFGFNTRTPFSNPKLANFKITKGHFHITKPKYIMN